MESAVVSGADRGMADGFIAHARQAILKEIKTAYQKIEIVEPFSYGNDSYFCELESEPEQGTKRQGDGERAAGRNKRARRK